VVSVLFIIQRVAAMTRFVIALMIAGCDNPASHAPED
jgi:hypothetical protein